MDISTFSASIVLVATIFSSILGVGHCEGSGYHKAAISTYTGWMIQNREIQPFEVPELATQFAYECYYLVGEKEWSRWDHHLCRQMVKYKYGFGFRYPFRLVEEAYQTLKAQTEEDEKMARECAQVAFTIQYGPCKGLTWSIPAKPSHRQLMQLAYYKQLQENNFRFLHKTEKEIAALKQQLNQPLPTPKPIVDSFARDGARHRDTMVRDCIGHRHIARYPSCYGILWGYEFDQVPKSSEQLKLIEIYRVFGGFRSEPVDTHKPVNETEEHHFREKFCREKRLRQLANHCFHYHTWDTSDEQCRGVTFGKLPKSMNEDESLVQDYIHELKDTKRLEIKMSRSRGKALLIECLYFTEWLTNPHHECHRIAYRSGHNFNSTELRLQRLYHGMVLERQVEDCYFHHRLDRTRHCWGISWDVEAIDHGRRLTKRQAKIKVIWEALEQKEAKEAKLNQSQLKC